MSKGASALVPGTFWFVMFLVATILVGCGAGTTTATLEGDTLAEPQEKVDFVLTDTEGRDYHFAKETEGKVALLYFGYTQCPDICPVHLAQIARSLENIGDLPREVEVVFVSVDPDRDTPADVRSFLDHFDTRFVGLTGSQEELAAALAAVRMPPAKIDTSGGDYIVDHPGWVIAYAPDGVSYTIYPFGTTQADWDHDLPILAEMGTS